ALYSFGPDVAMLAWDVRSVIPELWQRFGALTASDVDRAISGLRSRFEGLLSAFRARSPARLVVHLFESPPWPSAGTLDAQRECSQRRAMERLNHMLGEVARVHRDVYVLDVDTVASALGRARFLDERKWLTMRLPYSAEGLLALSREWVRLLVP